MRTLKFKPQPTVYVFRCRQSSKQTSWETEAHFSRVKRSRLSVVIGRFCSILFVSMFQGLLAVAIIMIDSSKNPLSTHQVCFQVMKTTCHFHLNMVNILHAHNFFLQKTHLDGITHGDHYMWWALSQ